MVYTDTIAAIATALSSSGIGIIRISGSDAVAVAERMFEPAVAMSGLFKLNDRIPADHGVVKAIEENDRGYYVTVTFEYE